MYRTITCVVTFILFAGGLTAVASGQLVNTGGGPGTIEPAVAALDFGELQIQQMNRRKTEEQEKQRQAQDALVGSGTVSALDLAAPDKAVKEYNTGLALLRSQQSPQAIEHFGKAIALYPKFVSAHNALGMAYSDVEDTDNAKREFELAVSLDPKYVRPIANLGRLAVARGDYQAANQYFEQAQKIRPRDVDVLTSLAYAQEQTQQYAQSLQTVARIHQLPHDGNGNAHYIAAASALALQNAEVLERELTLFLKEDPANPLAPVARQNLQTIAQNRALASNLGPKMQAGSSAHTPVSLADTDRLKTELAGLGSDSPDDCKGCGGPDENSRESAHSPDTLAANVSDLSMSPAGSTWTIRKGVDEVALFFAVSSHGHMINDLELSNISVRDDGMAPERILQFASQSKLPLRVGLLVDVSGSVHERFGFEKYAAARFLEHLLTNPSDLAFVAGFSTTTDVAQDFTASHADLEKGINSLKNGGGTSLFDAVSFACGKLAAYPETERVAKVLVVLSDGEDNSSHTTLRRAISDAETSGVTIYAISTKETGGDKTAADKVLEALAERSGGEALFPQDTAAVRASFDRLHDIIRSRYLIAYKPAAFEADGKYRTITVSASKNGSKLKVHARKGYHARVAPSPAN